MSVRTSLVSVAAAACLVVAPAAMAQAAATAAPDSALRLATDLDQVDTLNPFTAVFNEAISILNYEYESLAGIVETGDYGGLLADDFSTEGNVWTYHIRDNAGWSDGEPITSDDVIWTYEAVMNDKALQVANGDTVMDVDKVTAVDDKTVQITTLEPTAVHPGLLPIVPKHIWESIDNPAEYANTENVVGGGPFVLSEFKQGTSITMTANSHYGRGAPGVSRLDLIGFKNSDAEVLALRNGEIDMLGGITPAQFDSLGSVEGVTSYRVESQHFFNLTINGGWKTTSGDAYGTQNPVLEDQAFRRALGQAVDRQALLDRVINGLGTQGPSILPPGSPGGFYTDLSDVSLPMGTEEAAKSLEAAGYTTDASGNRLDKDGNPITLRLMFNGGSPANSASAEFIQSWFTELGIKMEMKSTNWDEMGELIPKGDYDMYVDGWGVGGDPNYMLSINTCASLPEAAGESSSSQSGMCDPEYDALFDQQRGELDHDKRADLIKQALTKIYEYGNTAVFYYDDGLGAYRSDRLDNLVEVKGSPYNRFSVATATLKTADGDGSGGLSSGWLIGIGGGIALIAAVVIIWIIMRRKTDDDRK